LFFDKSDALEWINTTTFPKVFKLRGGAGSQNVQLVKSRNQAIKLTNKAFSKGFPKYDAWGSLKERYRKYRLGIYPLKEVLKAIIRLFGIQDMLVWVLMK